MFDDVHLGWLGSDDYKWAAELRDADARNNATTTAEVTPRDNDHRALERELLGDLYEPDRMRLPDRIRDGRQEDDNPPGVPWRRGQR